MARRKKRLKVKKLWMIVGALIIALGVAGLIARVHTDIRIKFSACFPFTVWAVVSGFGHTLEFVMRNVFHRNYTIDFDVRAIMEPFLSDIPESQLQAGFLPLFLGWLAQNAWLLIALGGALLFISVVRNMLRVNRAATLKWAKRAGVASLSLISIAAVLLGCVGVFMGMSGHMAIFFIGVGTLFPLTLGWNWLLHRLLPHGGGEGDLTTMFFFLSMICFCLGYFGLMHWQWLFAGSDESAYGFFTQIFAKEWYNPLSWFEQLLFAPCIFWQPLLAGAVLFGALMKCSGSVDVRLKKRSVTTSAAMKRGVTCAAVLTSLIFTVLLSAPMYRAFAVNMFGRSSGDSLLFDFLLVTVFALNLFYSLCWMCVVWRKFVLSAASRGSRALAVLTTPIYLVMTAGMTYVSYTLIGAIVGTAVSLAVICFIFKVLYQGYVEATKTDVLLHGDYYERVVLDMLEEAQNNGEDYIVERCSLSLIMMHQYHDENLHIMELSSLTDDIQYYRDSESRLDRELRRRKTLSNAN